MDNNKQSVEAILDDIRDVIDEDGSKEQAKAENQASQDKTKKQTENSDDEDVLVLDEVAPETEEHAETTKDKTNNKVQSNKDILADIDNMIASKQNQQESEHEQSDKKPIVETKEQSNTIAASAAQEDESIREEPISAQESSEALVENKNSEPKPEAQLDSNEMTNETKSEEQAGAIQAGAIEEPKQPAAPNAKEPTPDVPKKLDSEHSTVQEEVKPSSDNKELIDNNLASTVSAKINQALNVNDQSISGVNNNTATDNNFLSIDLRPIITDALKPMLKEWLDNNLGQKVDEILSREIAKIIPKK
jgi:cell pole-organizing protein PopZ